MHGKIRRADFRRVGKSNCNYLQSHSFNSERVLVEASLNIILIRLYKLELVDDSNSFNYLKTLGDLTLKI